MATTYFRAWARFTTIAVLGIAAGSARAATLYVSPQGKDTWSGTVSLPNPAATDGPLASLPGARDAVRALLAKGNINDTVRVLFAEGEYPLAQTVVFTLADAGTGAFPVVYQAAPGAHPVFLGGREIKGFQKGADGIWRASVPEAAAGQWGFEQLFVGGRRAVRAREPDLVPDSLYDVRLSHAAMEARVAKSHFAMAGVQQTILAGGRASLAISVGADASHALAALSAADWKNAVLMAYFNWDNVRRFVKVYEGGSAPKLITEGDSMKPWNPWKTGYLYHVENFKQALDQPGEWFLDPSGSLAYIPRPGEDPAHTRVFAPALEKWMAFQGDIAAGKFVEHIRFRGLSFRYSQWLTPPGGFEPTQAAALIEAALMADGARDLAFADCEFGHTGGYGVWFRRGCQDIRMERCLIHDVGAGGLRIGVTWIPPAGNERTSRITIDNSIIRSAGHLFPCAVGLWVGQSGDNNIIHNDIGDLSYSAISSGWTWGYGENLAKRNHFDFNHLHHIGKGLMSDLAAYYGLGLSEGGTVNGNVVHDVYAQTYGGWGLYTDEGSTGVTMAGNLVYNTKTGGFHQHYGADNDIRGNIFAYGVQWQAQFTRAETHLSFAFTGNILYWDQGTVLNGAWEQGQTRTGGNLYWDATGKAPVFPGNRNLAAWQTADHDSASRVANPLFVDPGHYDFRFQSGSPAPGMGFAAIDFAKAGVYGDAAWVAKAKAWEDAPEAVAIHAPGRAAEIPGAMRITGVTRARGGLRIGIFAGVYLLDLALTLRDARGRATASRRFGAVAAGAAEFILPVEGRGIAFLELRGRTLDGSPLSTTARIPPMPF